MAQDDTIVKFIGSQITYNPYSDPVRVASRENGVDSARYNFGVAPGDSLWGNGPGRIIHGGMEFYGRASRGARLEGDNDRFSSYVDGNEGSPSPSSTKLNLLWLKENFQGGGATNPVSLSPSSVLKIRISMTGSANPRHLRWVIRNGTTYYLSEYVDSNAAYGWLSLTNFVGNSNAGFRWGQFSPTATNFFIPSTLPAFSARTFTNVTAVGFIFEDYRPDYGHQTMFDSLLVIVGNKVWNGSSGTLWNTAANWTPSGVPGTTDNVLFDGRGPVNCSLNVAATIQELRITGDTLFLRNNNTNYNLTCSYLRIAGGNLTAQGATLTINGDCRIADVSNVFTCATSTVVLNASGTVFSPANNSNRFYNLRQADGITTTLISGVMMSGVLTGGNGSVIRADASNREFRIGDTPVMNTMTWGGGVGKLQIDFWLGNRTLPGFDFGDCDIRLTAWTGPITIAGNVVTTGDISTGTDNSNGRQANIYLGGHNLTCRNLTLGQSGAINRGGRLYLDASTATITVSGDLSIHADDGINANALIVPSGGTNTIRVGGSWLIGNGGEFIRQNSTVVLNGTSGTQTVTPGNQQFHHLVINAASTIALQNNINCTGDFTVLNGRPTTFSGLGGKTITVGGDARLEGTSGSVLGINPSSAWSVNVTSPRSLYADFANIANSNATGVQGIATGNCTNGGGNTNWSFGDAAPTISLQPVGNSVNEGQPAAFTVSATGNPSPQYEWRKYVGGVWTIIPGATSATYSIAAAQLTDAGSYSVRVYNSVNSVISNAVLLTVNEVCIPPVISDTLKDSTVRAGTSFTLRVTTSAGNNLRYQWFKNGASQPADTFATKTFASVAVTDSGLYKVRVYNGCGTPESREARIRVCQPPQVTANPTSQTVIENGVFRFDVTATGTGLVYQWQRQPSGGGAWENVGSSNSQYSGLGILSWNRSLIRSQVSNGCGSVTSAICTLYVNADCTPPNVTADPVNRSVDEKTPVTFTVTATGTNLSYQWLRNGAVVADTAAQRASYAFTAQYRDNGALYRCVVTGQCGFDTSSAATLTVRDTTKPNPTTNLTLNAVGPTAVDIKWTTPESDSSDADSVFVYYSTAAFARYDTPGRLTAAARRVVHRDSASGERDTIITGLSASTKYYVSMWLRDTRGNWAAADSDTVRTPATGAPTNPVVVRGTYVSDTQIRLRISNFCALPSAANPFSLYADWIGVWWRTGTFTGSPDTAQGTMIRLNAAALQAKAGCPGTTTVDTVITVGALTAPDSLYFLSVSVRWRRPDSLMAFVRANGDSVVMRDMSPPTNALGLAASYLGPRGDSARIVLSNTGSIQSKVASVMVRASSDTLFSDTLWIRTIPADSVRTAPAGTLSLTARNAVFDGDTQVVYVRVTQVSSTGVRSPGVTDTMRVGHPLPANPLQLTAIPLSSSSIELRWPSITGADSIRIFYGLSQFPTGVVDVEGALGVEGVRAGATADTVRSLNPATLYYFAAQARIGGDWTAVSTASRAYTMTPEPNPNDTIQNLIALDSVWFDASRNAITFAWHYIGGYNPAPDTLEFGYSLSRDSASAVASGSYTWAPARKTSDTAYMELGESIVFMERYWVSLKLRKSGGVASAPADSAVGSTTTPWYTWEPIVFFRSSAGDTVRAFNDRVQLWFETTWAFGQNRDTLEAVAVRSEDLPAGMLAVGFGFRARANLEFPAMTMALRYDSIPAGYTESDIRVYRRTADGQWVVYHDFALLAGRGMLAVSRKFVPGETMVLGIDTRRPQVNVLTTDGDSPLTANTPVYDTIQVSDNVAGVRWELLYSRGEDPAGVQRRDSLLGVSGVITTSVPGGYVTTEAGVRIYVIVSDGRFRDTINLSRQVIRPEASDVSLDENVWNPVRTTALLDEQSAARIISRVAGTSYDPTKMRLFRWFDTTSTDGTDRGNHGWVEYSASKEAAFNLKPGELQWLKVKSRQALSLGRGTTVSLRAAQTVTLAPGEWTDIALPYRFGIYLGDILDATGTHGDSLHVYKWQRPDGAQWVTEIVFGMRFGDDELRRRDILLSASSRDVYSVYNPLGTSVTLRIPPTTATMSGYHGPQRVLAKAATRGEWALKVLASGADGQVLSSVILGHVPQRAGVGRQVEWYPSGPSFGGVRMGVRDAQGRVAGHAVSHWLTGGGVSYEVVFVNDGEERAEVSYAVAGEERLGSELEARVVDPQDGTVYDGLSGLSVSVPAKSRVSRVVTVGARGYYRTALVTVEPLAQLAAYPNPVGSRLTVQFMLPQDMGRVELNIVDLSGRTVWRSTLSECRAGVNRVVWQRSDATRKSAGGVASSSGMYLLQVKAFDTAGKNVATKQQRLILVR